MAITSGFFNSLNGDRKYDARQMGEMFDGLIEDGVFMSVGDALKTVPSSGMTVAVGTGRAWFLHTWTKNDSDHLITVSAAESVLNRIDTIVLDVDNTEATRENDIILIKGTPSSNPQRPSLIDTDDHKQIPLADILVPAGSTQLTTTNITNIVGTSECPYVTGPLSIIQNDDILEAWQEEFDTWFEDVKGTLGTDTAGQLYNLIQQKVDKTSVLDTMDEVELTTEEGFVAGALAVKELNDKTKVKEYTQSAWDNHTVRFYKIGNIVICVNTAAHAMPQANFKASYCDIPSACRPITRAYTAINEWDGHQYASTAEAMVEANDDMIYYRTSSAENRERNFTLVWLTS